MSFQDQILNLTKQLYPTGRAFKMRENGIRYRLHKALALSEARAYSDALSIKNSMLHKALALSEARAYSDALSIKNSILPDNANFTTDDATQWERRLGLITNGSVPLEDRKAAIARKMNHPGTVPARENYRFLEKQLRDAGFDVYVTENRFSDGMGGYYTMNPVDVGGGVGVVSPQYGDFQYGDQQYGGYYGNLVVNYLDEVEDSTFDVGGSLKSTFFVSGQYLSFADVDFNRKLEFRQIILRTKPVQTVGFLFINYV